MRKIERPLFNRDRVSNITSIRERVFGKEGASGTESPVVKANRDARKGIFPKRKGVRTHNNTPPGE